MANIKYAVYSGGTSSGKIAYKIYKINHLGKGIGPSGKTEVEVVEPIAGVFFAFRKGETFLIRPSNLFDNKKRAIMATLKMIKNLTSVYKPGLSNKPKEMLDNIFKYGDLSIIDFEKLQKKFLKELRDA